MRLLIIRAAGVSATADGFAQGGEPLWFIAVLNLASRLGQLAGIPSPD